MYRYEILKKIREIAKNAHKLLSLYRGINDDDIAEEDYFRSISIWDIINEYKECSENLEKIWTDIILDKKNIYKTTKTQLTEIINGLYVLEVATNNKETELNYKQTDIFLDTMLHIADDLIKNTKKLRLKNYPQERIRTPKEFNLDDYQMLPRNVIELKALKYRFDS